MIPSPFVSILGPILRSSAFKATALAMLVIGWPLVAASQTAPVFTVLSAFPYLTGGYSQQHPSGPLVQASDGKLYGAATDNVAYVFRSTLDGVVSNVTRPNDDKLYPISSGLLQASDDNFYATTDYGTLAAGQLLRITTAGATKTIGRFSRLEFTGRGSSPVGSLVQGIDGRLYGTTTGGGTNNAGTIYAADLDGGGEKPLYSFDEGDSTLAGLTLGSGGILYGITSGGVVFSFGSDGDYSVIHALTAAAGTGARASLTVGSDGALYGTTLYGGAYNNGTIFRVTTAGALTVLHSFTADTSDVPGIYINSEGMAPLGPLVDGGDGYLYGAASQGGGNGTGTLFRVDADGDFDVVYQFGALTPGTVDGDTMYFNADGAAPNSMIKATDGNLYATTYSGGQQGAGVLFRLSIAH